MSIIIEAKLRGPSSLVWPVEPGFAPQWMPNYGDFTGPLDSPEGTAVLKAWQEQTPLPYEDKADWYVVEVSIRSDPE